MRQKKAQWTARAVIAAVLLWPTVSLIEAAEPPRPWVSGEGIPSGTPDRRAAAQFGEPRGHAFVFGGEEPDLFIGSHLYRLVGRSAEGVPVLGQPRRVSGLGNGPVFQTGDGTIHGWWLDGNRVRRTVFRRDGLRFEPSEAGDLELTGMPRGSHRAQTLTVIPEGEGKVRIVLGINDGSGTRPVDANAPDWRSPNYQPYDGAGIYRGRLGNAWLTGAGPVALNTPGPVEVSQLSPTREEALVADFIGRAFGNLTPVDFGRGLTLATGSWFGNLMYYPTGDDYRLERARLIAGPGGTALRHPQINARPLAYPNPETGLSDLLVAGTGTIHYYRFTGMFLDNGAPVFDEPTPLLEENGDIYAGSLPVVNAVDWTGNGVLDIVTGNAAGRIVVFRNDGTNSEPALLDGEAVHAAGRPIHIQPGYGGSIQGPQESRWGYTCPTITDWTGNGLPDIVLSSATARHKVFVNTGSPDNPVFGLPETIFWKGLDLHGTWRVQPGIGRLGGRTAYIALDDDDEFRLYWKIDDFNVEDGGKLRLEDGSPIRANFLAAGGTGRSKIVLTDWNQNGRKDLLVGTPRHGSIPDPQTGLPQSLGLRGAAVVFLENVGTNEAPVFARPTLMKFRGEPIYLGQHACSPAVWDYGQSGGPDLLVGRENGRIYYFKREDLSWGAD